MRVLIRSAKELARHLANKLGADAIVDTFRSKDAVKQNYLNSPTRRERFSAIYTNNLWSKKQNAVPASGDGSSLKATVSLRNALPAALDRLGVLSLADLGCGDFTWMRLLDLHQDYFGVDVVPSVIESNRANFENAKRHFLCLDIVEDELPGSDAILCREILFHLSFSDIRTILKNCAGKPRKYLLATTDSSTLINADIRSGDFRRLNLQRPPFSFPVPDEVIQDDSIEKGRVMAIWRWDRLPI